MAFPVRVGPEHPAPRWFGTNPTALKLELPVHVLPSGGAPMTRESEAARRA